MPTLKGRVNLTPEAAKQDADLAVKIAEDEAQIGDLHREIDRQNAGKLSTIAEAKSVRLSIASTGLKVSG
jgi:hypothetical protein